MTNMDIKQRPTGDSKLNNVSSSETPSIEEGIQSSGGHILTDDPYHLATLGYKQEFFRSLGFFESWAATFTSMNFVSGIPVLLGVCDVYRRPRSCFC